MGVPPNYVAKLVGHSIKTMERHYENIQLKNLEPELVEVRKKKLEQDDFQTYDLEFDWSTDLEVVEESPLELYWLTSLIFTVKFKEMHPSRCWQYYVKFLIQTPSIWISLYPITHLLEFVHLFL